MNKIDLVWYKSLRFLSTLTSKEVNRIKKEDLDSYRKEVPEDVENTLHQIGYIQLNQSVTNVVTQNGLQQLRDLEDIRRKDLTLISAVVAVIISFLALGSSIISLAKSMGWT